MRLMNAFGPKQPRKANRGRSAKSGCSGSSFFPPKTQFCKSLKRPTCLECAVMSQYSCSTCLVYCIIAVFSAVPVEGTVFLLTLASGWFVKTSWNRPEPAKECLSAACSLAYPIDLGDVSDIGVCALFCYSENMDPCDLRAPKILPV